MSYILEALRRAEAERTRAQAGPPDLLAPVLTAPALPARRVPLAAWLGLAALLLGLGLAGGAVLLGWRPQVAASTPPTQAEAQVRAPAPAAPRPAMPASALVQAQASAPAPALAPAASRPSAQVAAPAPAPPPPRVAAPRPAAAQARPEPRAAAAAPLPTAAELPAELRRELPSLAVGGSVWSDDPASRFLLVNNEVLREGQRLGHSELLLERLAPHEAVFNFRGTRWRMAF